MHQVGFVCGPKEPIQPMLPGDELPGESTKVPRFAVDDPPTVKVPLPDGAPLDGYDVPDEGSSSRVPSPSQPVKTTTDGFSIELSGDSAKDPKAKA